MYQNIAIPVDGSETSRASLRYSLKLAKEQGARVRLIHVVESVRHTATEGFLDLTPALKRQGESILDEAVGEAQGAGVEATTALLEADGQRVASAIVDEAAAARADLLAIGTHGRHGIERLLIGSVAEGVASLAKIPVLLIHDG